MDNTNTSSNDAFYRSLLGDYPDLDAALKAASENIAAIANSPKKYSSRVRHGNGVSSVKLYDLPQPK